MSGILKYWKHTRTAGLALALLAGSVAVQAEDTRMYAFSSGALTIGKGVLQNFGPMDPLSNALAEKLTLAIQIMNRSGPVRVLEPG